MLPLFFLHNWICQKTAKPNQSNQKVQHPLIVISPLTASRYKPPEVDYLQKALESTMQFSQKNNTPVQLKTLVYYTHTQQNSSTFPDYALLPNTYKALKTKSSSLWNAITESLLNLNQLFSWAWTTKAARSFYWHLPLSIWLQYPNLSLLAYS